jgi:peptide deformylase
MIRKIVDVKNPVLRQKAKAVKKIDKKIRDLIRDLEETLASQKEPEGVGLAAPQIGKSIAIFVVKYKTQTRAVINPQVLTISKKIANKTKKTPLEGCLSLPYFYSPLRRAEKIKIKYLDKTGKSITEEFTGFMAQIIQHELDHLQGKLFIDYCLEHKLPLYEQIDDHFEEVELI